MLQLFMTHAAGWNRSQKTTWFHLYNILEKDIKSDEGEISAARENGGGQHVIALTVWGRFWRELSCILIVFTQTQTHSNFIELYTKRVGGGGYFYCKITLNFFKSVIILKVINGPITY